MIERRKHARFDATLKITWGKTGKQPINNTAFSKNISEGGICIIVDEKIDAGEILNLKIGLTSQGIIQIQGKIDWVNGFPMIKGEKYKEKYATGIEFINVSPVKQKQIKQFISTLQEQKTKIKDCRPAITI